MNQLLQVAIGEKLIRGALCRDMPGVEISRIVVLQVARDKIDRAQIERTHGLGILPASGAIAGIAAFESIGHIRYIATLQIARQRFAGFIPGSAPVSNRPRVCSTSC